VTTVAVWAHQVAFNTDRFTALVSTVVDEPAVIDPLAAAISTQVVEGLDVQGRLEARLPDAVKPLAGPLTLAFADGLEKRLQVALRDSRIQNALVRTVSFAHERVMNLLRGDKPESVSIVDGYVVIDVVPVVAAALAELQSNGLIPADFQLPDLSNPELPGALASRLETALGVTLPDDFGTIRLMPADRILAARSVVRIFDLLVIMLIVLSVILVALAIWLARDRRRMVLYLAIGTIIVFLLARLTTNAITSALVGGIANQGLSGAVRTVLAPAYGLVETDDDGLCCGAGGAYALLQPALATDIRDRKAEALRRARAGAVVVSANPGCMLHLRQAGVDVRHPADLLADVLIEKERTRGG